MNKLCANTVWLLFGHGHDSKRAFCPPPSDHPDAHLDCTPLYVNAFQEAGFNVDYTNDGIGLTDVAAVISFDSTPMILKNLSIYPRKKCFFIQYEPPAVAFHWYTPEVKKTFGKIFTMMDDFVDGVNYFKLCMAFNNGRLKRTVDIPEFENKKLCALFNSNKSTLGPNELYSERRRAIQFLSSTGEFDLYGPDWEGVPSWKGKTDTSFTFKVNNMRNYKFVICYENMGNQRGYVSEKLLDAFVGGCVPIYLGATNVTEYIPSNTFIDKRLFSSYEDLYKFMKSMNKETYLRYLKAADDFLNSPHIKRFSFDYFKIDLINEIRKSQIEISL